MSSFVFAFVDFNLPGPMIESLGWTLVHFVWQALVIAIVTAAILRLIPNSRSVQRYSVACFGLLVMLLCPLMTFAISYNNAPHQLSRRVTLEHSTPSSTVNAPVNSMEPHVVPDNVSISNIPPANTERIPQQFEIPAADPPATIAAPFTADRFALAEKVRSRIGVLTPWLVLAWVGGVVFLSLRMMVAWFRIQGVVRAGRQVSTELAQQCQNISRKLGIGRVVRLLESSRVAVPSVLGFFKPVILLPASTVTGLSNDTLLAILAHELAHVRRADFLVNLIQSVVEILLFYHPAVWWLSSRVRAERENCCDDLASEHCGGPHPYATALLQLEVLRAKPGLSVAATDGDLVSRISRLVGRKNAVRQLRPLWLAAASSLLIAGIAITSLIAGLATANSDDPSNNSASKPISESVAKGDARTDQEKQETEDKKLIVVTVSGPDGKPIPGAIVHSSIAAGTSNRPDMTFDPNQMQYADEQGHVTIKLPDEYFIVRLWARADGYVPLYAGWESEDFASGDRLPAEFTFELEKGTEIGGVVVNEKGEPIIGALVQVKGTLIHPGGRRPGYDPELSDEDDSLMTDEQGRWTINNAPASEELKVEILLDHPDYLRDANWGGYQNQQGIATESFRDKTARVVMKQGVTVSGKIITPDGKPVDDGLVVWGDDPYGEKGSQETRIVDGQFQTPPLLPGKNRITVMAPGWSPQTREVEIHAMMETIDFELVPGKTLSILIVDQDNNPVPGAYVQIGKWRGVEAIYNHRHPNVIDSRIPIRADQGGLYRWTWAPEDEIGVSVSMPGFSYQQEIKFTPGDETHVVKLNRPSSISGSVVDKTTGKKIENVSVIPVTVSSLSDGSDWYRESRSDALVARNGEFQISLRQFAGQSKKYRLRIEAMGFAPLESETFDLTSVPANQQFELEPQQWPSGRVVDGDGNPVKDAVIHLAYGRSIVSIQDFTSSSIGSGYVTRSAEEGSFNIPPLKEPFTLIAAHKNGIAEVVYQPGDSPGDLRLQAWANVEGHVFDENGNPVSGLTIVADPIRYQYGFSFHIQHHRGTKTDEMGFFRFEQLPPMRYAVRTVAHTQEVMKNSISTPILAGAGETVTVDIGKGIPARGQFKLTGSTVPVDYESFAVLLIPIAPPLPELPDELEAADVYDWRGGWTGYKRLQDSGDPRKRVPNLSMIPWQNIGVNADGSFLIQLPQSGEYDLVVKAMGKYPDSPGVNFGLLADQIRPFSVEKQADTNTPIDLGVIEIISNPVLNIGDELPNIVFTKNNGQTLELKSLRGKTAMLDFWCPYCEVCNADKQRLTEFAKELEESGKGDTTRILSIQSPGNGQYTRAPNDESAVWLSGLLKDMHEQPELNKLGIYSLPRYLIVDENGRLRYHGNLDGAIEILNK